MGELFAAAWEAVISWLMVRHDSLDEDRPDEHGGVERRARVVAIDGGVATLAYADGTAEAVGVPDRIGARPGMAVKVVDSAEGRRAYLWGA